MHDALDALDALDREIAYARSLLHDALNTLDAVACAARRLRPRPDTSPELAARLEELRGKPLAAPCSHEQEGAWPVATYTAWEFDDGYVLSPGTDQPAYANGESMVGCCRRRLFTVEAPSWEEAMRLYHERMGWAPYLPLALRTPGTPLASSE